MIEGNFVRGLSGPLRGLIILFILVLSLGFYLGINFVHFTTNFESQGIVENYLGNEDDEDAEEMKFIKSEHEMLSILHTHFLSMSLIFLVIGVLVYGTSIPMTWKSILMIEPMVSVLLTFGGVYIMWRGIQWMSYVVMLSGILMTLSFTASVAVILFDLLIRRPIKKQ